MTLGGEGVGVEDLAAREEVIVRVSCVACCVDEEVEREGCAGVGGGGTAAGVFEDHVDAFGAGEVDDFDNLGGRVETGFPFLGIGFEDTLLVEGVVEFLEELLSHDAVVGGLIGCDFHFTGGR